MLLLEHFYLSACINNTSNPELYRIRRMAWTKWEDIINKDFDCDAQTIKGMQVIIIIVVVFTLLLLLLSFYIENILDIQDQLIKGDHQQ